MKTKYRTTPVGYRNLTPTERIKKGDIYTAKSNLIGLDANTTINNNGWCHVSYSGPDMIGIIPAKSVYKYLLKFARPITPKHSTSEPLGTQSAKTVEGQ